MHAIIRKPLLITSHSWKKAIHKERIFWKNLLKNKEMVFENGVKNIQAAADNGARTVYDFAFQPVISKSCKYFLCQNFSFLSTGFYF